MGSDDISTELKNAQAHIYEGRFDAALKLLNSALAKQPDNIDALYMKAVAERYLKQSDNAFSTLAKIKQLAPEFGRAYQEEGHLYRTRGNDKMALNAYIQACTANPALDASWRAQAEIFRKLGRNNDAAMAQAQSKRLAALPKELLAVTNLIHEGKLLKAEQLCRQFLQKTPHHIEAMRLLADIGVRFGVLEDADFLLESAIEFDPDNIQVRLDYIQVLRKRQKFDAALKQAQNLLDFEPENPMFQSRYAVEAMQSGQYDTAFEMFDKVLEQLPGDVATLTSLGHAQKTVGQHDAAIKSYHSAIKTNPAHSDAFYALANLKTYNFSDEELTAMQAQESVEGASYKNRINLCFALGKAYEDRADYEQSFTYYQKGNGLKLVQCRYDSDQMDEELSAQASVCNAQLFDQQSGRGNPATDPIFIVGLPRAGSTLLEQILASHSAVDGTLELPNILSLSHRLRGHKKVDDPTGYPNNLISLSEKQLNDLGDRYINETKMHRLGAPFFTDKMPNNFRHIGLINLILPNAKIIDARREPMACCFSGFKQLFAEGQEFTYGLDQIGRYYKSYVTLMDHWHKVLPGKILAVQHEDVLDDLESQVRRILDFCDLPFEQACIDFHKTDRAVRTASSEQVRRPIFKSGADQWRNFEPWLDPLKNALGDTLANYRAVEIS